MVVELLLVVRLGSIEARCVYSAVEDLVHGFGRLVLLGRTRVESGLLHSKCLRWLGLHSLTDAVLLVVRRCPSDTSGKASGARLASAK